MPTTQQLRDRLIKKLKELFQLDQPDLDFGFYRVMHAKAEQVGIFLDKDLLKIISDAFGQVDDTRKAQLQAEYEKAIETAKEFGAPNPQETDGVKKAKAALDAAKDTVNTEGEIYDHLYRFFERYYDGGDFLSKRYYIRETSGKAAPFAVPYNGEEVKLHWANADQYYIKTAEYFSNFSFDITQANEIQALSQEERKLKQLPEDTKRVHFKIVEASEGEHGNVKASEANKRFFVIHNDKPVELGGNGELVVNFEYRPDPEKGGKQEGSWRQHRNNEATSEILKAIEAMDNAGEYLRLLSVPAPTESQKDRPLLAKYINQYTARNTMDYFIHKDLGGFLSRELDFYIKNEVMRLDDIENADAPAVESYLAKIKVLRKIAGKLIEFLAQLEEFQKKLWLKKKFVTETNYCITLDRVPEKFYEEIAANDAQREEWVKLFAIDEIKAGKGNLIEEGGPGYSEPLTVDFLKGNPFLVLDTKFFGDDFKHKLIESMENFDEQCDGLLVHSENSHALNAIAKRHKETVKSIYIDPPYNTSATEILYKNSYQHSSWLTLTSDRIAQSMSNLKKEGVICIAIDDFEGCKFQTCLDNLLGFENRLGNIVVVHNPGGRHDDKFIATAHEYCFFYGKMISSTTTNYLPLEEDDVDSFKFDDKDGAFRTREFRRSGNNSTREARPKMFYPILIKDDQISLVEEDEYHQLYDKGTNQFDDTLLESLKEKYERKGYVFHLPIDPKGIVRVWRWAPDTLLKRKDDIFPANNKGKITIKVKDRLENKPGLKPKSVWYKPRYTAALGTNLLKNILGKEGLFSYPKSVDTVCDSLRISSELDSYILDYFAGSGTTGNAVINLNREDDGTRKYILVEMGDYFDTVLKPRMSKVVYSIQWKDGKPLRIPEYIKSLKNNISDLKKELNGLKGFDNKEEYNFESQRINGEIEHCQYQIAKAEKQLQEGNDYYGVSHCFKYIRLESYEDTLNNLVFADNPTRDKVIAENSPLREDYMLGYLLNTETRGSQSLLNIDAFADPCSYQLTVKKPGTDEYEVRNVDLLETFNYLIGLRVEHIAAPQVFDAKFKREPDPELPDDQNTRLILDGKLKQDENGQWWFRKVEGWVPADSNNPNNGQKEKVLIVWRKLTGDLEKDNLMLDEWFQKNRISTRDFEFDTIYVNGSNNLPNLKLEGDNWKVRLIEEDFMKNMWDVDSI